MKHRPFEPFDEIDWKEVGAVFGVFILTVFLFSVDYGFIKGFFMSCGLFYLYLLVCDV